MNKIFLSIAFLLAAGFTTVNAQLNVGSTSVPDASAMLQVTSTNTGTNEQGFLPPHVQLTSAGIFGLTTATVAANAYGMIVYNTNASIASTAAYPSHGVGNYWWDGTGWTPLAFRNPTELAYFGNASAAVADNTLTTTLDISTPYITSANATITGSNTLKITTAGTYMISADCRGVNVAPATTGNGSNDAIFMAYMYKNGTAVTHTSMTQTNITGTFGNGVSGLQYTVYMHNWISYVGTFVVGDQITFKGETEGMPSGVTSTFEIVSLLVQHIQ